MTFWKALINKNVFLILPLSLHASDLHLLLGILASKITENSSEALHTPAHNFHVPAAPMLSQS